MDVNPEGASFSHFSEVKVSNGPRVEHEDSNVSTSLKENINILKNILKRKHP